MPLGKIKIPSDGWDFLVGVVMWLYVVFQYGVYLAQICFEQC